MLTSSTKYALRALISLTKDCERSSLIRVDHLSEIADVPGPYLSKLIKQLAKKKIVETRRGVTGGVCLSAKLESLTFFDVCVALEDPIVNSYCILSRTACNNRSQCVFHDRWGKAREQIHDFLKKVRIV